MSRALSRAFRLVWAERHGFAGTRDWLAHFYNGVVNRSPLPLPGRGGAWRLRVRALDHPILIRQGSDDWVVLREVLLDGEYDFARRHLAGAGVRRVVDLGSNIGLTLRLWSQWFPGAALVGVEPAASQLALARRNLAMIGVDAVFLHAAVAAESGAGWLDRSAGAAAWRLGGRPGDGEPVERITVEQVLARGRVDGPVDLLKVDVEGAERDLFAACRPWIGRVRHLLVELHNGYRSSHLLSDLAAAGARPEPLELKVKSRALELALVRIGAAPPPH